MKKISLANLPTKIVKLDRLSSELGAEIYMKRDDQTGSELSGNKVRKLEYSISEALEKGCDTLITCGGIQSNHCRATVSAATLLGLKSVVLLRISEKPDVEGNYFIDKLMGADVRFCNREEYTFSRDDMMQNIANEYSAKGFKPYIIPEGASNGIGSLGYYECMQEIVRQEEEMALKFDTIVVATGSGGTCAGLNIANRLSGLGKRIIGMCVCDDNLYFQKRIASMANDALDLLGESSHYFDYNDIEMIDRYVGLGYAISRDEELDFIKYVARQEGVIFDPVYTGKAMYGLYNEIKNNGAINRDEKVLFIHTGGLFGLFPVSKQFKL